MGQSTHYDGKVHRTVAGKVVWRRTQAPRLFTGADLIRIMWAVVKNKSADYVQWRAVQKVANWMMISLLDEAGRDREKYPQESSRFARFLEVFDEFVELFNFFAGYIPGVAWFVDPVVKLYNWVRNNFPV